MGAVTRGRLEGCWDAARLCRSLSSCAASNVNVLVLLRTAWLLHGDIRRAHAADGQAVRCHCEGLICRPMQHV